MHERRVEWKFADCWGVLYPERRRVLRMAANTDTTFGGIGPPQVLEHPVCEAISHRQLGWLPSRTGCRGYRGVDDFDILVLMTRARQDVDGVDVCLLVRKA